MVVDLVVQGEPGCPVADRGGLELGVKRGEGEDAVRTAGRAGRAGFAVWDDVAAGGEDFADQDTGLICSTRASWRFRIPLSLIDAGVARCRSGGRIR